MKRSILKFALLVGILLISSTVPTLASATPLAWTVTDVDEAGNMGAVSCPSASLCVAVDQEGDVITSTNPTGGAGAWTVTHVVGSKELGGYAYLSGISCPSVSLCVAVDSTGDVLTSTNPTGGAGAWTVTNLGSSNEWLTDISCPSVSLCVAVSPFGKVVTSTNPTGGAGAWTAAEVNGNWVVSCPSVSLCVGVGAMSFSGNVLTSTNPAGGAGAWTATRVNEAGIMGAVSCASVSLCVAVDGENSNVVTSTNPTGGMAAWTVTPVAGYHELGALSCPSVSLCVMVGDDSTGGHVITSTNPTGGTAAWTLTPVAGSKNLSGISCPSASLCVAVDEYGDVVVGTPATLPVNTNPPVISGTAQVGQTLSCAPGSWSGSLPQAYAYQWQRDGTATGGAVSTTYLVPAADQGHTLSCVVTASNIAGSSAPATSAPTGVIQAAPASGGGTGSTSTPPATKPPVAVQCLVPKLKGKTLAQAKKLLTRSHCKLGKVSSVKKSNKPKVIGQKPGPGKKLPAGSKIAISLG